MWLVERDVCTNYGIVNTITWGLITFKPNHCNPSKLTHLCRYFDEDMQIYILLYPLIYIAALHFLSNCLWQFMSTYRDWKWKRKYDRLLWRREEGGPAQGFPYQEYPFPSPLKWPIFFKMFLKHFKANVFKKRLMFWDVCN